MSTSVGDLLDTIAAKAATTNSDDRATALAHLGRMLAAVRVDGLTPEVDSAREGHVAALAAACWALRPSSFSEAGRLGELAAVTADAAATLRPILTCQSRWALAVACTDTAFALVAVDQFLPPTNPVRYESVRMVRTSAQHVARDAAFDPPTQRAAIVLDHPIPGPTQRNPAWAEDVLDSVGSLLHATRTNAEQLTVIQVLAVTLAAERLADLATKLTAPLSWTQPHEAVAAWRAIRVELRPFTDGTRRPQDYMPPVAVAAARLHTSATIPFHPAALPARQRADIAVAAQHLPALADNVAHAVAHWTRDRTLLANARDLPPREDRRETHLFRYQQAGIVQLGHLVRGDSTDLAGVRAAVRDARILAIALSVDVNNATRMRQPLTPTTRLATAHLAEVSGARGTATLTAARHAAYERGRLGTTEQPQPRRGRGR